jgi:N-acetylglucosamine-6-phosphate deacetylase
MRKLIKNGHVIVPEGIIENSAVLIDKGRIKDIFKNPDYEIEVEELIDAEGQFISPGFIDTHVHGGGGCDVMDCTRESLETIAQVHLKYGMTSFLPTTLTNSKEKIQAAVKNVHELINSDYKGARILGVHLEGPYFCMKYRGAQNPAYLANPSIAHYNELVQDYNIVKRVSLAPELDGAFELARYLKNRGINVSIAHSNADFMCVNEAISHGFSHITHMFNGMSHMSSPDYYCQTGVAEAGLLLDGLSAEIIADGKHMPPELLQLLFKCKGSDRMLLTTDATRPADMPEGKYELGGLDVLVTDGVAMLADRTSFAGSVATANRLVRVAYKNAGMALHDAVKMASLNHATLIGLYKEIGSITIGKKADIVIFDEDIKVKKVLLGS